MTFTAKKSTANIIMRPSAPTAHVPTNRRRENSSVDHSVGPSAISTYSKRTASLGTKRLMSGIFTVTKYCGTSRGARCVRLIVQERSPDDVESTAREREHRLDVVLAFVGPGRTRRGSGVRSAKSSGFRGRSVAGTSSVLEKSCFSLPRCGAVRADEHGCSARWGRIPLRPAKVFLLVRLSVPSRRRAVAGRAASGRAGAAHPRHARGRAGCVGRHCRSAFGYVGDVGVARAHATRRRGNSRADEGSEGSADRVDRGPASRIGGADRAEQPCRRRGHRDPAAEVGAGRARSGTRRFSASSRHGPDAGVSVSVRARSPE